ncbi:MAG: Hint domain-containing protein [Longimicrobiales bacterium]
MKKASCIRLLLLGILLTGCDPQRSSDADVLLTPTQLKYRLDERYTIFFCDPDYWPVVRGDEQERALQRFAAIAADAEKFQSILEQLALTGRTDFTAAEKLQIYREDKRLASITLDPSGSAYSFSLRASTGQDVFAVSGEIARSGRIDVRERTITVGTCPICLAGDTRIATSAGQMRVSDLKEGMLVWSVDLANQRILVPAIRIMNVRVPSDHAFTHVLLADHREILASPGHPTTDGRQLGNLAAGHRLDGSRVVAVKRVPADDDASTYDLLPAGPTGFYWANNVLIGSTLRKPGRE